MNERNGEKGNLKGRKGRNNGSEKWKGGRKNGVEVIMERKEEE